MSCSRNFWGLASPYKMTGSEGSWRDTPAAMRHAALLADSAWWGWPRWWHAMWSSTPRRGCVATWSRKEIHFAASVAIAVTQSESCMHVAVCWLLYHSCKRGEHRIHPRSRHLFIFPQDRKGGAMIGLIGEAVGKPDSRELVWDSLRSLET